MRERDRKNKKAYDFGWDWQGDTSRRECCWTRLHGGAVHRQHLADTISGEPPASGAQILHKRSAATT